MLGLKATMVRPSYLAPDDQLTLFCAQNIIDNSGGLIAECINVLKFKGRQGHATIGTSSSCLRPCDNQTLTVPRRRAGDEIVCVIKKARPITQSLSGPTSAGSSLLAANKVRRGDVRRAVVVRTRFPVRRPDGRFVRFDDNAAVLVNNKKEPLGTRVNGVVGAELRQKGWTRIMSMATRVV